MALKSFSNSLTLKFNVIKIYAEVIAKNSLESCSSIKIREKPTNFKKKLKKNKKVN